MKKVLLVVAHPDDELLGMGGTIQKLVDEGNKVSILVLAKPGNARSNLKEAEIRLNNFKLVANKLRISDVYFESFPDTSFDDVRLLDIIKKIEKVLSLVKPKIVYTHFYNDLNIDHALTSRAVITATRPYSSFGFVKELYFFEVLSTTEHAIGKETFIPNVYVSLSKEYIDFKKELLSIYETEERKFPHPISKEAIEILSKKRGMEVGVEYAESFILYRCIK